MMSVVRGGKNPVLAHLFLNHVLDVEQAFSNFSYISYQQPLNAMTPAAVVKRGLVAAEPAEHADRGGAVQDRARVGPAQHERRDVVGKRVGQGPRDLAAAT